MVESADKPPVSVSKETKEALFILHVLGFSTSIPWNSYVAAADYFQVTFPGMGAEFIFAVANTIPLFICILIMNTGGRKWRLGTRIGVCVFVMVLGLLTVVVVDWFFLDKTPGGSGLSVHKGFYFIVAAVFCDGLAGAVFRCSLYGVAGVLGSTFIRALESGRGICAVFVCLLRIFTKIERSNGETPRSRLRIHSWGTTSTTSSRSSWMSPRTQRAVTRGDLDEENLYLMQNYTRYFSEAADDPCNEVLYEEPESQKKDQMKEIVKKIMNPLLVVFLVYYFYLMVFPGLITSIPSRSGLGSWMPVLMVFAFSLGDFFGREVVGRVCLITRDTPYRLWLILALDLVLLPPFLFGTQHFWKANFYLDSEYTFMGIALVLGMITGYLMTSCMALAPQLVAKDEKEQAGIICSCAACAGLLFGSLTGLSIMYGLLSEAQLAYIISWGTSQV